MRSPWRVATAVRTSEGEILVKSFPFISITRRKKVLGWPIIRGAVGLFEAMKIGIATLNWSAEMAGEEESAPPDWKSRLFNFFAMLFAFAAGIGLFMAIPYFVAGLVKNSGNQVIFHLVAGSLRIAILLGYMIAISFLPDITRVFRYHGAEHKSIFTFEKKLELVPETACKQSRFHPRCGTSFILLATLMTMLGFMLIDSVFVYFFGNFSNLFYRILFHLPLLPIVAGVSYEFLRIIEKHSESPSWQPLVKPGFMLQRITTREPENDQVEVALAALKESLQKDDLEYLGVPRESDIAIQSENLRKVG